MKMSRVETAMRTALKFNEAFNRHDVAGMMALMTDDCVIEHNEPAPDGNIFAGKEAIAQFWQTFFQESPQAHVRVEDVFGFGKRCVMRWRYEWTNAEGEKGHVRGIDIFQVRDDRICEKLSYVKG